MPRRREPPRLYLRRQRGAQPVWQIRDGAARISTECFEHEQAEAEEVFAKYLGKKWHPPKSSHHPENLLIAEILATYAQERAPHLARADLVFYSTRHLDSFWGARKLSSVKGATCRAYTTNRVNAGVSDQTARRELEILRASIGYFTREYGLDGAAPPKVTLPIKSPPRHRWLTRDEVASLVKCAWTGQKTRHITRFALIGVYSGTRPGAILSLSWLPSFAGGHVDLDAGIIHRQPLGRVQSKTKRAPPVRIHDRLMPHLVRWRDQDLARGISHVVHYRGVQIEKLRRSWASVRRRAGLGPDVVPHTLRHTAATWLMQAGVDRFEAAGYLGMTQETLEHVYGHHHPDFQKSAAQASARAAKS